MSKKMIITVSEELYGTVETLAKKMGVSIPEYVRFLILKAQEHAQENDIESRFGL